MRILQVIPYFHWSYGGPVRVVYDISRKLADRGHKVTIYTTDVGRARPLNASEKIKMNGVDIRYFRCTNNWIADKLKMHISYEMQNAISNNLGSFDVVHLHEFRGIPNFYVWYYAKKFKVPYILQAHGSVPNYLDGQMSFMTLTKFFFDLAIGKKIFEDASKIIALTDIEKKQYLNFGVDQNKVEIIRNGINMDDFMNLPLKGEFKLKYGIGSDVRLLLFLGRINKIKGIDLLIQAFSELTKKNGNLALAIVGPDDGFLFQVKDHIKNLNLEGNVILTGPLYGVDRLRAYIDAEIYILPSRYESFGITALEACACCIPIVITNACGIADIISDKCGLVSEIDEYKLAKAIDIILNDNSIHQKFSINGKKVIASEFNWQDIIIKLEKIYGGL